MRFPISRPQASAISRSSYSAGVSPRGFPAATTRVKRLAGSVPFSCLSMACRRARPSA